MRLKLLRRKREHDALVAPAEHAIDLLASGDGFAPDDLADPQVWPAPDANLGTCRQRIR
jgi:hypothetical protein